MISLPRGNPGLSLFHIDPFDRITLHTVFIGICTRLYAAFALVNELDSLVRRDDIVALIIHVLRQIDETFIKQRGIRRSEFARVGLIKRVDTVYFVRSCFVQRLELEILKIFRVDLMCERTFVEFAEKSHFVTSFLSRRFAGRAC